MTQLNGIMDRLNTGVDLAGMADLYGAQEETLRAQRSRYRKLIEQFQSAFPGEQEIELFSAPGRTEVGGNHTDHNAGRVLAAAVNLDILSVVSKTNEPWIVIESEGYRPIKVDIRNLQVIESEKYTSASLVRGVCARMKQLGYQIGGFRGCMTSNVPTGSGLSSSAAFEVMVVAILNDLYNQSKIQPVEAALIAQFAENKYFGKPSGLMDQTTSAVGGFVTIDFRDAAQPVVQKVDYQFAQSGFALAIIGTGGSHADLNEDYAAIANEMKAVARALGGQVLRDVSVEQVLENVAMLREKVNDRAVLRALHFFADNERVVKQVDDLQHGDFDAFLQLVIESGYSSYMYNQNVFTTKAPLEQGLSVALAVSEILLKGKGAWRVHGGGFAGTIQAFVPSDMVDGYMQTMAGIFGKDHCHLVSIRPLGAVRVAC